MVAGPEVFNPSSTVESVFYDLTDRGQAIVDGLIDRHQLANDSYTSGLLIPHTDLILRRSEEAAPHNDGVLVQHTLNVRIDYSCPRLLDITRHQTELLRPVVIEKAKEIAASSLSPAPKAEHSMKRDGPHGRDIAWRVWTPALEHPNPEVPGSTMLATLEPEDLICLSTVYRGILLNLAAIERLAEGEDKVHVLDDLASQQNALLANTH